MHRTSAHQQTFSMDPAADFDAVHAMRRSNRRRLLVFLVVFLAALLPALVWNFTRPAEYRASARVEIKPGTVTPRNDGMVFPLAVEGQPGPKIDLLTQAQLLTSRNLLDTVVQRMAGEGFTSPDGGDPVAALQGALSAIPVSGTEIVELQAVGVAPAWLAKAVNTLIAAYQDKLREAHDDNSSRTLANLQSEVDLLGRSIGEKRAQLQSFRVRSGVISSERSENQALARIRGLADSLNKANEDAAKADARLRTLQDSAASGRSPVLSKDNPTLAAIEQRISATREELREMERTYTPAFMEMDPTARALRARLGELEQQLSSSRKSGQRAALVAAEEDAAGARATVARLRAEIDGLKREAQVFSGQFQEAQSMEDDIARLEGARRNASERLAKLQASERARLPAVTLIDAATIPQHPWRPDYWRDALIALGAAFGLGLLAVWFVELFNRSSPPVPGATTTVVIPQPWGAPALAMASGPDTKALSAPHPALPLAASSLPRELSQAEVAHLLAAADSPGRLLGALMLLGLRTDEIRDLTAANIDAGNGRLSVGSGADRRSLSLPEALIDALATLGGEGTEAPLFTGDLNTRLACAAIDAGLPAPASVTPEVLRHTCIANLLRQGLRFSSLAALVGNLTPQELSAYAEHSAGPRPLAAEAADLVMPALRQFDAWKPRPDTAEGDLAD